MVRRWVPGSVRSHPLFETMRHVVAALKERRPRVMIIEEAMGFVALEMPLDFGPTPLQRLMAEFEGVGQILARSVPRDHRRVGQHGAA